MRIVLLWLVVIIVLSTLQPHHASAMKASGDYDDTIEPNPEYILEEPDDDLDDDHNQRDHDHEDDDEEEDDDDDESSNKKTTKSMLAKALLKPKKAVKLIQKHKTKIVLVLVFYAFRKEISHFFYKLISAPVYDRDTGKLVGRSLTVNPTSILKLAFFVQFMMRTLSGGGDSGAVGTGAETAAAAFFPRMMKPHVHIPPTEQHWTFERLNERYDKDGLALQKAIGEQHQQVTTPTTNNATTHHTSSSLSQMLLDMINPHKQSHDDLTNGTAIVMDLTKLTTEVAQMDYIRDQVSFILSQHRANQTLFSTNNNNNTEEEAQLEVIILLESPGGGAADYGLAAQQLLRLRQTPGILVSVCVDKVAASGGYMMAATAHQILAAPFSVLGSIGVYGQTINIHTVLEKWGVQDLIFRAGKNKAPLGLLGEVTQDGRDTIQTMIDATHLAFKYHVATARPCLQDTIDEIATGDVWLGYQALEKGLVDRLVTSDEYLGERMQQGTRVLKLIRYKKPHLLLFGPARSDYSVASLVGSVAAELKHLLLGSVEEQQSDSIHTRSFTASAVQTKSPIT